MPSAPDETVASPLPRPSVTNPRDHVESFARGLAILCAFGPERPKMTLSDAARVTGLQRSAARRFLLTLCDLGYAVQTERWFTLTPRVLELGYAYLGSLRFPELIEPYLTGLTQRLGESSSAAVLDGTDIVYVARSAAPQRLMALSLGVGTRLPAHATSMGQALLATLSDDEVRARYGRGTLPGFTQATITDPALLLDRLAAVRRDGFALNDQELELGLRSVAVAVPGKGSRQAVALNVATNVARVSHDEVMRRIVPAIREAAAQCARAVALLG
ncbi:IclR family transcriptional regulator C-terminal domain-containing protein [Acidocella sp. C78]|uniref:IclR family transcriptional regulator domain-containing protein n=1 Tax=Acidocella sp. C78 TaxID=1671486 RepID=UPI00191BA4CB|nr:IclR family transcriptional regulator C-terminal domain-containing protein [Acidocella sp. C78]